MHESLTFWISFNAFVLLMLVLDLGVFHRNDRAMSFKEASAWSAFWIGLAAAFAVLIYFVEGSQRTVEFVTGYVVEESLSVDNLFVFLTLFSFFRVPEEYQYKVLFWGIVGALVARGLFIAVGVTLIERFSWIVIVFGIFLIYTAIKMLLHRDSEHEDPGSNFIVRFARKHLRVSDEYAGNRFFVRKNGVRYATPLFLVLLVIEATDVLFAADSIPAVLAITKDAFIVYTSNVFAILGLRALYFALAGLMQMFHYLDEAVAVILLFVGGKMIAEHWYDIPTWISLVVIIGILGIAVLASVLHRKPGKVAAS
jgi:tellurite resistance protein TerC